MCVITSTESVSSEMSRVSLMSSSSSEGSRDSGYDGPADAFSATNLVSKPTSVGECMLADNLRKWQCVKVPPFTCDVYSGPAS